MAGNLNLRARRRRCDGNFEFARGCMIGGAAWRLAAELGHHPTAIHGTSQDGGFELRAATTVAGDSKRESELCQRALNGYR